MVVIKNLKTGEVCNFIIIFVGTYDYLIKSNTLLKNSYLHRESDFEGSVYYYKSGQRLVNGWRYKAGKIVAAISPGVEGRYNITTRAGRPEVPCSDEVVWIDEWRCWNEEYDDSEFGRWMAAVCQKTSRPGQHQICADEGGVEQGLGMGEQEEVIIHRHHHPMMIKSQRILVIRRRLYLRMLLSNLGYGTFFHG